MPNTLPGIAEDGWVRSQVINLGVVVCAARSRLLVGTVGVDVYASAAEPVRAGHQDCPASRGGRPQQVGGRVSLRVLQAGWQ